MTRSAPLDKRRMCNRHPDYLRARRLHRQPPRLFVAGGVILIVATLALLSSCTPLAPPFAVVSLHPVVERAREDLLPPLPLSAPLSAPEGENLRSGGLCPLLERKATLPLSPHVDEGNPAPPVSAVAADARRDQPRSKFGVDPLHPIRIADGALTPTAADPLLVAETGAGWVRLNFILGPWRSPVDRKRHHGCTWQETYRAIIDGYKQAGVNIYGLISYEAMPTDPGAGLRAGPPPGVGSHPWLDDYVANFIRILRIFGRDVTVVETLNEPDDWHGGRTYWIHPAWFAVMQQRIYTAVKNDPALRHITIVSGPLQGMTNNNNGAPRYLRQVYRAGKERYGWGETNAPFPFDGVGLHLYLRDRYYLDSAQQSQVIEQLYRRYLGEVERVIAQEEGAPRPLYLSEIGWASRPEDEALQAANLRTVFKLIGEDSQIALAIWFAIQDFSVPGDVMRYGLYRQGSLTPDNRKPAFAAFRAAVSPTPAPPLP